MEQLMLHQFIAHSVMASECKLTHITRVYLVIYEVPAPKRFNHMQLVQKLLIR